MPDRGPPTRYSADLSDALDSLFRPLEEDGFWDADRGTIARALKYVDPPSAGDLEWQPDRRQLWRYGPFALMGVLYWRASELGDDAHDEQIRRALDHAATAGGDYGAYEEMPSYGLGSLLAAFSMAADVYDDDHYRRHARQIYDVATPLTFSHSEDVFLVYGATYLYEATGDERVRQNLDGAVDAFRDAVDEDGLIVFESGDAGWSKGGSMATRVYDLLYGGSRPRRHQNQMYALWALCRACEVTGRTDALDVAEGVLDYTVARRMQEDGAFVWEDVSTRSALTGAALSKLGLRVPHWEFLYACHQTFFVNAVAHYYQAGGDREYDREVRDAMAWLYGENVRGADLTELSGIGVPMRQMTTDGGMGVDDQMYKGTYEIGSHVMALTNLLEGTVGRTGAVEIEEREREVPAR